MGQKLYQLLISESEKREASQKMRGETLKMFKAPSHFEGFVKTYQPLQEDGESLPADRKEVVTTVPERLAWTRKFVEAYIDFEAARDCGNLQACADVIVDEKSLLKNLPATFLLALEKRLPEIRAYYNAIPTLDLAQKWDIAPMEHVWRHGPVETHRTTKITKGAVLYDATDKHPAQVEKVTESVRVGTYNETKFSGCVHPCDKARWLERIDALIVAVKEARQRANGVEIAKASVAGKLFDFIHGEDNE